MYQNRTPRRHEDDEDEEETPLIVGTGDPAQGSDADDKPVAALWLRDPEQRHGWREYYIRRPEKPDRLFGFRKPGGK